MESSNSLIDGSNQYSEGGPSSSGARIQPNSQFRPWSTRDGGDEGEVYDDPDDGVRVDYGNGAICVSRGIPLPAPAAVGTGAGTSSQLSPSAMVRQETACETKLTTLETAAAFLQAAHGSAIGDNAKVSIWTKQDKKTAFFADVNSAAARAIAASGAMDVYFGCACYRPGVKPPSRGSIEDTVGIAFLWADIDIRDVVAHKNDNLPPDIEAALGMLRRIGLWPSIIVRSGYGLQAYWLLDRPWMFAGDADRQEAQEFLERWSATVNKAAVESGYYVDAVFELARVFRVPGTLNHKGETPRPVMIDPSTPIDDRLVRFAIQQIDAVMVPKQAAVPSPQPSCEIPALSVEDEELVNKAFAAKNGKKFQPLWRGEWQGKYKSQSHADFGLCGILAFWAGPNPDRIDRLFRCSKLFRGKWDEPHCRGGVSYGRHTIERALKGKTKFYRWDKKPDTVEQQTVHDAAHRTALPETPTPQVTVACVTPNSSPPTPAAPPNEVSPQPNDEPTDVGSLEIRKLLAEAQTGQSGTSAAEPLSSAADHHPPQDVWARSRNEVFHHKRITEKSTGTRGPDFRAWIELKFAWTRAGMGQTAAAFLIQALWKASDKLDHPVSIAATARDIGIGRPWATEIKAQLCSLGIIKQTGEVLGRGVLLSFRRHDDMVELIQVNRAVWKRRRNDKDKDDNSDNPSSSGD